MIHKRQLHMLVIEDNPGDILMIKKALTNTSPAPEVVVVYDGEQALRYLRKEGEYTGAKTPDVVLLDLNLPRLDGREVLEAMKHDPALKMIPVNVLTSSDAKNDILEMYDSNVNCYVVKPLDYEQFIQAVQAIHSFWHNVAQLPSAAINYRP